jgi:hypothetical protein
MALVHVVTLNVGVPNLGQEFHSPETEHCLLAQPIPLIASVERIRQGAIFGSIFWEIGIEQINGDTVSTNALYGVFPSPNYNRAMFDLNRDTAIHGLNHVLRIPVLGFLGLASKRIQMLTEITLAIHKSDSDERSADISSRAERIPGQHAQAAAVGWDGGVEGDLHREICNCR